MRRKDYKRALQQFALDTLRTLEESEEWGADTLEEIAQHAFSNHVACVRDDMFIRTGEPSRHFE